MKVQSIASIVALAALGLTGCGQPPAATFAFDERTDNLIPEAREKVVTALKDNFGAPNDLVGLENFPIDYGKPDPQADPKDVHSKPGWRLVEGRNLYMTHCQHCHGVTGDGKGPTSRFLNPRPRDYRQGKFKFKSTQYALKPSRKDLLHILEQGIPGTYMPSFVLLGQERLGLIIDYVRWLSIRGNTEIRLATELAALGATTKDVKRVADDATKKRKYADVVAEVMKSVSEEMPGKIDEIIGDLAEGWANAELDDSVVVPKVPRTPPTKESIDRGRKFFLSLIPNKKTECVECHGKLGRGDGPNTEKYWKIPDSNPEQMYEVAGLHDDWGFPQSPRNLTRGIYRGGRRPIDIFRRVHEGIPGTQMAGFAKVLTDDKEIWDVVNYVLSIPFEGKHSAYPTDLDKLTPARNKVANTSSRRTTSE